MSQVTDKQIEAGREAYTRWQQNTEPTDQTLGEAIYLAMRALEEPDVERVARAILLVRYGAQTTVSWHNFEPEARAAIEAMNKVGG